MSRPPSSKNASDYGRLYYTVDWKERPHGLNPRPGFERDGYRVVDSQLGEDPLTALRTMRSRLTHLAEKANRKSRPILSQLALSASESLSGVEAEIARLQSRRSDALYNGDAKTAEKLSQRMRDLSDQAIFKANADMLLDKEEASIFGVKSKWSQSGGGGDGSRGSRRGRRQRAHSNRRRERDDDTASNSQYKGDGEEKEEGSDDRAPRTPTPRRRADRDGIKGLRDRLNEVGTRRRISPTPPVQMNRRPNPPAALVPRPRPISPEQQQQQQQQRSTRRNRRMLDAGGNITSNMTGDGGGDVDGVEPPVSNAVICHYCDARDPGFVNEDYLKRHFANDCPNLTKCEYCDAIVEPSELNDHQLHRCPFVENTLEACEVCGLARYPGEDEHPKCRGKEPPDGGAWCPLCSSLVKDSGSKEGWKQHIMNDCYGNPRLRHWPQIGGANGLEVDRRGDRLLGSLNKIHKESPPPLPNKRRAQQRKAAPVSGGGGRSQSAPAPQNEQTREQAAQMDQLRRAFRRLNQERRANYQGSVKSTRVQHDSDSD